MCVFIAQHARNANRARLAMQTKMKSRFKNFVIYSSSKQYILYCFQEFCFITNAFPKGIENCSNSIQIIAKAYLFQRCSSAVCVLAFIDSESALMPVTGEIRVEGRWMYSIVGCVRIYD
jgi:hypothetical protein